MKLQKVLTSVGYLICISIGTSSNGQEAVQIRRYNSLGRETKPLEMSIISQIFNRLVSEENAQCLVWVVEDQKRIHATAEEVMHKSQAIILFEANNITGASLDQAGKMCPHHVMNFGSIKVTLEFLNSIEGSLRYIILECT